MVNRIDNSAYLQSRMTRDSEMEMLQKIRQQQADDLSSRQLKERVKRLLDEYHEVKKLMKAREDGVRVAKEINKNRRKKSEELDDAVALLAQHVARQDAASLAIRASAVEGAKKDVADRAKENTTVDSMKSEMQADMVSTAKRESDQLKQESEVSLIVESTLQEDRHREKDNAELQAVIVNAAVDNMQDTSVKKELLTGLPGRQSMMQHAFEAEQKMISASDRQFNYPFKSWAGDPSVNMVMQEEATIAEASDDRVQRALQAHQSDWQQDTPLIIMKQRDDQEKEQKAYRSGDDENGDDE